jgi:hypothetical protein
MEVLTEKNFILYAAKNYRNPSCKDTDEFLEDIRRIKYIKKLITRYVESGILKERLILNHLIVLSNVFPPEVLCRILYLKMKPQIKYLKPFLLFLNVLTNKIKNIEEVNNIETEFFPMDDSILEKLRQI